MKNMDYIDIHGYEKRLEWIQKLAERYAISQRNKNIIKKYDQTLAVIDRVGIARRVRVMEFLLLFARDYLKKDYQDATRDDMKRAIALVDARKDYSVWTKQGYRVIVKKFYRWLTYGDEYNAPDKKLMYPEIVSWISCNIPRKDLPIVRPENILTEVEIIKLLDAANSVREEALIATLYEDGCRIGEHGGVRLKHVMKDEDCYIITVKGKTGSREVIIAKFANLLTNWLNAHPYKNDPDAPLWVKKNTEEPLLYRGLCKVIKTIAKRAGITKRIYPHIFRHSRATHGIVNEEFTQEGAKKLFGWTPDSKMLETYIHLTSKDVKDKYLEKLGLRKRENNGSILDPKICPECKHPNLFNASICENCRALLDANIGISMDKRIVAMKQLLEALCRDNYIQYRVSEMAKENSSLLEILKAVAGLSE